MLFISLFFGIFGAVYEHFSHEVYSYYMIYAFAIPLLLGTLPYALIAYKGRVPMIKAAVSCQNAGIITLTTGCAFKGVLDIYGTTNRLIFIYPAAGIIMLLFGIMLYAAGKKKTYRRGIRE